MTKGDNYQNIRASFKRNVKMASSLSEEEFHRMQLQLLELRTANYELDGKCKKQEREISLWKEKTEAVEKDLQKANKAIQKSKKAQELELLFQENDGLQRKLQSQEDEFRLQNQTLMQELSSLVARNEELEKQVSELGENKPVKSAVDNTQLEDEVRRLQAQNTALQKNLAACQEKIDKEHQHRIAQEAHQDKSSDEINADNEDSFISEQDTSTLGEHDVSVDDLNKEISALNLSLETELEEKKILKEQLTSSEKSYKDQVLALQDENEKISEKLKKKQESFMHLQEEKENLFAESNKKVEELQAARDRDQKYYTDQINKLQQELEKHKKNEEEILSTNNQRIKDLEASNLSLKQQVDAQNIVGNQQLQEQNSKYRTQISDLQQQFDNIRQEKDDLTVQLQECKKASQGTLDQLYAVQKDRDQLIQNCQEANKVAEKRKSMLDELANTYQRDNANHQDKLRKLEEEHEAEIQALQSQCESEKKRSTELEKIKQQNEELKQQLQSLEETKGWLERRLKEVEESFTNYKEEKESHISSLTTEHESIVCNLKEQHKTEVESLREKHQQKLQECCDIEESLKQQLEKCQNEIQSLKQNLKDGMDDKKLHEKKGMAMVKDLKRQLQAERKRAEKLQNRLEEVLSDSKNNRSMEELFGQSDGNDSLHDERSSVSSWSYGASLVRDSSIISGGSHSPDRNHTPPNNFDQEHNELVNRVAELQQEKWNLEEKLSHLETSTSAMADDLIQKTRIIEHYVMESKKDPKPHNPQEDKLSLKKVLDLVNKGDDIHGIKEMNRKLQRMLEETLTKNMHLEQGMETLSQELMRLSKKESEENQEMSASAAPPVTRKINQEETTQDS